MGADLILMSVPKVKLTDARKQKIRQFLNEQPAEDLLGFAEDYCISLDELPADSNEQRQADHVRQTLYADVLAAMECEGWRDTCNMRLPGMDYEVLITGGLSWGDSPTDACDVMQRVDAYFPLWELLMQFAKEDVSNSD